MSDKLILSYGGKHVFDSKTEPDFWNGDWRGCNVSYEADV